MANGPAV